MALVVRPRAAALAPFVQAIAYMGADLPPRRERMLPTGEVHLMINLCEDEFRTYENGRAVRTNGAVLGGPRGRHTVIDTREQRSLVIVTFAAGGAAPFFPVPLSEARDQMVELSELWGRDGAVLRERLLETLAIQDKRRTVAQGLPDQAWPRERDPASAALDARTSVAAVIEQVLLDRVTRGFVGDPAITHAAAALDGGSSVASVVGALGWSPSRFVRRFQAQVGLTPKRYGRVRRLQRVLAALPADFRVDWAEMAVRHGFYDQAHLVNDFRELTGITPAAYQAHAPEVRNHVPVG